MAEQDFPLAKNEIVMIIATMFVCNRVGAIEFPAQIINIISAKHIRCSNVGMG